MAPETAAGTDCAIRLKPISHPDLGDIPIDDSLFPVGRTEPPFASYPAELVADLSRRHARIFAEFGAVYVADLDSKNGTTVNGAAVRGKPRRLQHGDEIRFGRGLAYRVELAAPACRPGRTARLTSLTLTPERDDLGLEPIVVSRFPFLVGKGDETFGRYREAYPHQVNYLSRRHAHIFLKGGAPFVEDLGSTNGTFVAGQRLEEHAVPLQEGDLLAFGGHHFVYRVGLQREEHEVDPTVTQLATAPPAAGEAAAEKTTFVAAPDSFLDIFCVDQGPGEEAAPAAEAPPPGAAGQDKGPAGGRLGIFLATLGAAFGGAGAGRGRLRHWGPALAAILAAGGLLLALGGAPEREVKERLARGDYAGAAAAADRRLARDPDDGEIRTLETEALLKAYLPAWTARLRAGDPAGADAALAALARAGSHNPDAAPLVKELQWLGQVEKFIQGRGGLEAPIRVYADEDRIKALLAGWNQNGPEHQRAVAALSAHVPEFKDAYALVLSHLRKLQSDDAVYLAAIERLKGAVGAELQRDRPAALEAVFREYEEKYPRLGLDALRRDLRLYLAAQSQAESPRLGPLVALASRTRFSTLPFQARFQALAPRLPPADLVRRYDETVARPWRRGDSPAAFAGLEKLAAAGPWADRAARELAHKKAVVQQFAELAGAKGGGDYDERLLAFYGALDPVEDAYFVAASATELGLDKGKAQARAQALLERAREQWRQYRENGAIDGEERLAAAISERFRGQARRLAEAQAAVRQGLRIYSQLQADIPAPWRQLREDIDNEAELQRRALLDSRGILAAAQVKAKLSLLGGAGDEDGQAP